MTMWIRIIAVVLFDVYVKQEILKRNLQAAESLSPLPPSPFGSSWFPVTCYGQFALPVCKELNVYVLPVTDNDGIWQINFGNW